MELEGYADRMLGQVVQKEAVSGVYELPYHEQEQLPEAVTSGRIVGVVTTDGCGACTGIDTLDMAYISNPATLVDVKNPPIWFGLNQNSWFVLRNWREGSCQLAICY